MLMPSSAKPLAPVQMFWHGAELSRIERLSISSFVQIGHPVDLYVYEEPQGVPAGVRLMEAEKIIPHKFIFRHHKTGSLATFIDWFRYQLLLERGGIWADADIICLRPFVFTEPVVFGWTDRFVNNAVLAMPAGHELAYWMTEICKSPNSIMPFDGLRNRLRKWARGLLHGDHRDRLSWADLGPKGLTAVARYLGYLHKALPEYDLYPVRRFEWQLLFENNERSHSVSRSIIGSYCVHMWANMARQKPGFDKNGHFPVDSPFEQLCRQFLGNAELAA